MNTGTYGRDEAATNIEIHILQYCAREGQIRSGYFGPNYMLLRTELRLDYSVQCLIIKFIHQIDSVLF